MSGANGPLSSAPFVVCIDFKNPHAFLANEPTWALVEELNVDPLWLPFIALPLTPPTAVARGEDRGTRHRRLRAAYADTDIARYARVRGVTLIDPYRAPDSSAAAIALLWVNRESSTVRRRFVTGVFDAYWRGDFDLESPTALRAAIVDAGGNVSGFDDYLANAGGAERNAWQSRLNEAGVFNVPAYVIGDEIFYGRAHLPMVRWLLTGKAGAPPL